MYKQTKCFACNELMVGEFINGIVMYKCPIHSYTEPIGQYKIGAHLSDNVFEDYDTENLRRAMFRSFRDEYSHGF